MVATDGTTAGPDRVHHVVGVTLEQGAQHQQPIQRMALRLGLHGTHEAEDAGRVRLGIRAVAPTADAVGQPAHDRGDIVTHVLR